LTLFFQLINILGLKLEDSQHLFEKKAPHRDIAPARPTVSNLSAGDAFFRPTDDELREHSSRVDGCAPGAVLVARRSWNVPALQIHQGTLLENIMDRGDSRCLQVTAALIPEGGRLFIAQRPPHKKFGLMWEFPGGKVEIGETLEESLAREIREELCWDIRVGDFFRQINHETPDLRIDLYAFWCTVRGGTLCLREHAACCWAYPEELRTVGLTLPDLRLLPFIEDLGELPGGTGQCTSA
jgi:8-oxo-dGTP diphosphatase